MRLHFELQYSSAQPLLRRSDGIQGRYHERQPNLSAEVTIRPFQEEDDASEVRELFIVVNRLLSPPSMRDAFEAYIARALTEEMERSAASCGERGGCFWVARRGSKFVGIAGLEAAGRDAMDLRVMYVDSCHRRGGIL